MDNRINFIRNISHNYRCYIYYHVQIHTNTYFFRSACHPQCCTLKGKIMELVWKIIWLMLTGVLALYVCTPLKMSFGNIRKFLARKYTGHLQTTPATPRNSDNSFINFMSVCYSACMVLGQRLLWRSSNLWPLGQCSIQNREGQ